MNYEALDGLNNLGTRIKNLDREITKAIHELTNDEEDHIPDEETIEGKVV